MESETPLFPCFLHGGDYNPDQWLHYPEILEQDIDLMKKAHCNAMSVGIFAWSALEPEEGRYEFGWLDDVIDRLFQNGIYTILATPSGARPAWMSQKYPEVLRVDENRVRHLHGQRHNHCLTSPIYREKVHQINFRLAEQYREHPGVILWHISNEYGGDCHCPLCQSAFREWVKERYRTLEALNHAWWTPFWSHTYSDWNQIESPSPIGENSIHGLNLDWKRFVTDQTVDFMKHEVQALRQAGAKQPVTTNFMLYYEGLNYFKFKDVVDVVSWDSYPQWHVEDTIDTAVMISAHHDLMRSIKGKPFMLMESTPSMTNWQPVSKLKRPGMHMLSSMQAVAHGSDTVQYFQWRKSRGAFEKLHGAVVDHYGKADTRVFGDVTGVGKRLEEIKVLCGAQTKAEVAIIYDWENLWAINDAKGPRNAGMGYQKTVLEMYRPFWQMGIAADLIDMECSLEGYKLVIAPMLYMLRGGIEQKIRTYVDAGGCFVTTYWSGIADESDLCFLGGFPGGLMDVMGIRSEEIDALADGEFNGLVPVAGNGYFSRSYSCSELCDLIHVTAAVPLMAYESDFYKGRAAITLNRYGKGRAFYIAARAERDLYRELFTELADETGMQRCLDAPLPEGVTAQKRTRGGREYIFILNFNNHEVEVDLGDRGLTVCQTGQKIGGSQKIEGYGVLIVNT